MARLERKARLLERRRRSIRTKVSGSAERPRLSVRRSLNHIYAQLIDDTSGRTLAEASSVSLKIPGRNLEAAKQVGKALGERAKAKSITRACFDRNGRRFHGRIRALAEAAREAGLEI